MATGQGEVWGLVADDSGVYWTSLTNGQVLTCPLAGCGGTPTVLATAQPYPSGIAVDGANVYWTNLNHDVTNGGQVMRCAKAGCAGGPTVVVDKDGPAFSFFPITTDGQGSLFWGRERGALVRCVANACTPTPLTNLPAQPSHILLDGAHVYWTKTNEGGAVARCATSGCATPTLYARPSTPRGLATDAKSLYFAEFYSNRIFRVAK